jgi:hypothetical protein
MTMITEYDLESDTWTHPPTPPARQAFRAAVAEVAAKAKEKLPAAVNGRVESAVKLVLAGDVFFCADGTVEVGSASDPTKTYTLAGHACDCQDFAYGQAPEGWCQHRIAAGIAKRVAELLPPAAQERPALQPGDMSPPAQRALPEARSSANVRIQVCGHDVQITLRDHDESALLVRLEELLQRFPAQPPARKGQDLSPQQHNAAAMHQRVTDFCPIHNVQMKENHKEGRTWWSHYEQAAGRWCKGR